jgi:hypothetical protein
LLTTLLAGLLLPALLPTLAGFLRLLAGLAGLLTALTGIVLLLLFRLRLFRHGLLLGMTPSIENAWEVFGVPQ